ncbi:AraC family transcriptional regulator [Flectobacillus major]|uniref:AraC family transcriptional regulator n=1 Tax=Flectobacillus major TaxID=103 RepID=UPI0005C57315|nr:AraC family transcriptional regulator [Flectobacillus major]
MKPLFRKVQVMPEQSFSIRQDIVAYFYSHWHYHPELEIVHIHAGTGMLLVGDGVSNYREDDLIFIGSNAPHFFRSDPHYFEQSMDLQSRSTVIHFDANFWGEGFLKMPEAVVLNDLFIRARKGLLIRGEARDEIGVLMASMLDATSIDRVILLLKVLRRMANASDVQELSKTDDSATLDEQNTKRIDQIYSFSLNNFTREITLEEVAEVANISVNSFCRYFKTHTRKTYFQFLLELRIGHACKLLAEEKLSISQVAYESGFNNLSHFNRSFKAIMQLKPQQYQKLYRQVGV